MTKAIRIHEYGGPEKLIWEDVDTGQPGEGEVRLRQTAVGLNYIDVYQRSGLYPLGDLPKTLGMEAAGVIEDVLEIAALQPEVQGHQDRADLAGGVETLEKVMRVGTQDPDPVAFADSQGEQGVGKLVYASLQIAVVEAHGTVDDGGFARV